MFYDDCSLRPDLISNILRSTSSIYLNSYKYKVLSIRTRTECEIVSLMSADFLKYNIKCIGICT